MTSGVLDWGTCAWGARPVRFAKRRWQAPVVDLAVLAAGAAGAAGRWVERTRRPKVVVATQTRTLEAAVDVDGTWVPSVPALAVVPHDPGDLWHLGAALAAPAATVWLARRAAGTGLERGAVRVSGPALAELPLPADRGAWDGAAAACATTSTSRGSGPASASWTRRRPPTGCPRRSPHGGGPNRLDRPGAARASVGPEHQERLVPRGAGPATWFGQPRCHPGHPGMRLREEQPSVRAPSGRLGCADPQEATWPDPYTRPVRHPPRRPGARPGRRGR